MERKFDLRRQQDREVLAGFLPTIDSQRIVVPPPVFVGALTDVSCFLGEPEWLTYQWGMVGPLRDGKTLHPLALGRVVRLGLELRDLSRHDNIEALLAGFANPRQFFDTMFEAHTASFFSRLNTTRRLRFAPVYTVRGRQKCPDFDVINEFEALSVECKRPHLLVQRAARMFQRIVAAVRGALKAIDWPADARIEIEILGPLREQPSALARRIAELSLAAWQAGRTVFVNGACRVFVVPRDSPFQIPDPKFGHDVVVVGDEPTGLFDPRTTMMRIVHNGLDHKFSVSAGSRIAEALRQLPEHQSGIVVLGDVPPRVANEAIARRIDDSAYDHVLAFAVCEGDAYHFSYRTPRREQLQRMLSAGLRPLFAA